MWSAVFNEEKRVIIRLKKLRRFVSNASMTIRTNLEHHNEIIWKNHFALKPFRLYEANNVVKALFSQLNHKDFKVTYKNNKSDEILM